MTTSTRHASDVEIAMVHRDGVDLAVRHFSWCGRPLVLLHGLSASSDSWRPVADRLRGSWRVIALDLRGHGASGRDTGGYSFGDHCADVSRVLDALGERVVLVGHSLGGVIAAHLAQAHHPLVTAVFLEDPPLYGFDPASLDKSGFARLFSVLRDLVRRLQAEDAPVSAYATRSPRRPIRPATRTATTCATTRSSRARRRCR